MYKKLLLTFCLPLISCIAFAADIENAVFSVENNAEADAIAEIIENKVQQAILPSTDSSERGVVKIGLRTTLYVTDKKTGEPNEISSAKECSAVVIAADWLVASKHCTVLDDNIEYDSYQGAGVAPERHSYKVDIRTAGGFKVYLGKKSYKVEDVFDAGSVYLLKATGELKYALGGLPKANIYVSPNDIKLQNIANLPFVVNRKSYVFGVREVKERKIESVCTATKCITVKDSWSNVNAGAGDPFFIKLDNGMEFLFGFNAAQNYTHGERDVRTGRQFKYIDESTKDAILKVISEQTPDLLGFVKKKMVSGIELVPAYYKLK